MVREYAPVRVRVRVCACVVCVSEIVRMLPVFVDTIEKDAKRLRGVCVHVHVCVCVFMCVCVCVCCKCLRSSKFCLCLRIRLSRAKWLIAVCLFVCVCLVKSLPVFAGKIEEDAKRLSGVCLCLCLNVFICFCVLCVSEIV